MKILHDLAPTPEVMLNEFKELGVRQIQIARYLNVSIGRVSQLLNGYVPIPSSTRGKLSALLERAKREAKANEARA